MRTPEEIMQELESRVAVIQEQAGRAESLLAESETTAADEDEIVTVTVNAGGTLTGLRFSPQARGLSGTGLADLVRRSTARPSKRPAARPRRSCPASSAATPRP
jgi:hypothetical protein